MAARRKDTESQDTNENEAPNLEREEGEEIDVTDDGDDDEEGGLEAEPAEQQSDRKRKKRERYERHLREADDRVREATERAQAVEQRFNDMRVEFARMQSQMPQQQPPDPFENEIHRSRKRQVEIHELFEKLSPEEQQARQKDLAEELQRERDAEQTAISRREMVRAGVSQRQQDPNTIRREVAIQQHAGDILQYAQANNKPEMVRWGLGRLAQLHAQGYADNEETLALAAEDTRKQFGLPSRLPSAGRRPAPERSSMTSVASNGGGGNGGGGERRTVKITPEFRKMALARYPNLPAEQAVKQWAKHFSKMQAAGKVP